MGIDRGINAHAFAAECHVYRGHPDRALALCEEAVALAKRVDHPFSLANALFFLAFCHVHRGELDRARERAEEVVVLADRLGFPFYLGLGRFNRAFARVESGKGEAGIAEMQQAMVELARIAAGSGAPSLLFFLAEGLRKVGRHDEALGALALGVAQAEGLGQHYYDAELQRLRAEILLDMDGNAVEEAEALFGQAWRSPAGKRPRRSSCAPRSAWRGSGSARASATPPAPSSPRSTPGSPKASLPGI
jgi:tetratricopeptide (TPR) repeat protein